MAKRQVVKVPAQIKDSTPQFPIVGIGASAGGLAAFENFFSGMPLEDNPNMAFVLVQHLSPDHVSILAEIIRRYTRMAVFEVEEGMKVEINCVYVIPPGYDMAFLNGKLQLLEPSLSRSPHLPIDFFFHSLAQDQHEHSIGIILSGSGSDGTQGIKAIKEVGGLVLVQTPETTEYDSMPRSAIATDLVDYILPPSAMPNQLIAYRAHTARHSMLNESLPKSQNILDKIFILLRAQTGHDFSQYKPNTILRRIERRLVICQIDEMGKYVKYLQQSPDEVKALFHDLLIGVTNFFRDSEAFVALREEIIPKLFISGKVIRVWSVACSSGEEAYSIAILIKEYMEETKHNVAVQIFATDIDIRSIEIARAGFYPESIASNISPERLSRFFVPESGGYRIHKSIRDMLIFSEHSVIKDPPFSKLDLICCRNLLIYMNFDLQRRLIPLFHYALNPGGTLFLGSSETIGEFSDLFSIVDQKSKLYQRKIGSIRGEYISVSRPFPSSIHVTLPAGIDNAPKHTKVSMREMMEQALLSHIPLSGAIIKEDGDILYLHGRTGRYLEPQAGEAGAMNIFKMAREELRRELSMALHKAIVSHENIHYPNLCVQNNGLFSSVNLTVRFLSTYGENDLSLYLVVFEEIPFVSIEIGNEPENKEESRRISLLTQELYDQETFLKIANQKLQTSNEELKSFNEEMQSLNEELQSTNEELETSKEELQSVNEELSTVNAELQSKVADLSRANNDMNNLLAGTNVGTVFVDHQLCIMRFTPAITKIIHLILSDIGRPVGHIVSNLIGYNSLVSDTRNVLDTLIPKEVEVCTTEGGCYSMRIQPYRTLENVIEGAVITFIDITEIVKLREALKIANELSSLTNKEHLR
ncbi:MAG: chemotaxis protein CheB [Sulfuricurvum sp.]|uniref:CheR family methyltransferase n=1 Tax=Sulfuricurvum sp. TaxID=2025608 RepID=UPI002601D86C|nr:CheR family methyltransferase [Sulfuricurvum sp.]MDD2828805.1 chemotaxis protein CheB [Sulfuricurvum sp.]MDD4948736.1 chemotaxis protein CheB [Sulfuricurvum sp.]